MIFLNAKLQKKKKKGQLDPFRKGMHAFLKKNEI